MFNHIECKRIPQWGFTLLAEMEPISALARTIPVRFRREAREILPRNRIDRLIHRPFPTRARERRRIPGTRGQEGLRLAKRNGGSPRPPGKRIDSSSNQASR